MAVLIAESTRVVVQGLTGEQGRFHSLRNRAAGTNVVAGVTPGKGGQDVEGIPVFDTVVEAVQETGANTSVIYVPARFAAEAVLEAADGGVGLVVAITEGIPVADMARVAAYLEGHPAVLIGPNCPGLISPGRSNVGIIPHEIAIAGRVALVSRSGTLTYQIVNELTLRGIGDTDLAILIGEIGGDDEERAAAFVGEYMTKPVVAYVAGFTAPPGKRMGHAGAIITGSSGTAQAKAEAFEAVGVKVGRTPTEVAELVEAALA